jgi:Flp pilus assembly pilin Flp
MRTLLARLWADDRGAVISVEMILVIAVLVFGIIPGLVALRNGLNVFLASVANAFIAMSPAYTTSEVVIGTTTYTAIIPLTGVAAGPLITGSQLAPIPVGDIGISPAP